MSDQNISPFHESEHSIRCSDHDGVQALVYLCNSLLLHVAALRVDASGESSLLNNLIADIAKSTLTDDAQALLFGMVRQTESIIRTTLHEMKKDKP